MALGWLQGLQTIRHPFRHCGRAWDMGSCSSCFGKRGQCPTSAGAEPQVLHGSHQCSWSSGGLGGTQVLLTANEQMSPDVGPRALKIRSMITEFVAQNNASLAGIGGFFGGGGQAARLAAATRMWATYLQSHGDVSDMPFQVGGITVPGNSRTRGAVPATDIAAAIDDLTANGRVPALCAFRVKVPERVARSGVSRRCGRWRKRRSSVHEDHQCCSWGRPCMVRFAGN